MAKACESCSIFKHVLWAPNTQVLLAMNILQTHVIHSYNSKVYKYTDRYKSMNKKINKLIDNNTNNYTDYRDIELQI